MEREHQCRDEDQPQDTSRRRDFLCRSSPGSLPVAAQDQRHHGCSPLSPCALPAASSNRHQLLAAHQRGKDFLSGGSQLPLGYDIIETKCNTLDPVWAAKVESMWLSGTRPSENKKDELKNPRDRSDPMTYRVRFLERGLEQMVQWMNETGRREVCPEFSVSRFYVSKLKPFFVKRPGRWCPRLFY